MLNREMFIFFFELISFSIAMSCLLCGCIFMVV
jgi:hypothetical protein